MSDTPAAPTRTKVRAEVRTKTESKPTTVVVTTDHSPDMAVAITPGDKVVFRLPRMTLFAVALFAISLFCVAGPWILGEQITSGLSAADGWRWVGWVLFLIPLGVAWRLLRVRTEVDGAGIRAVGFRSANRLDWSRIAGIRLGKRGAVFAETEDGTPVRLSAVTFSQLPRLAAASGGRIPALD
jgi:hypothetical protein